MLACGEAQELRAERRIPWRPLRDIKALECHAASDRLRSHRFVAARRERLTIDESLSLSLPLIEERADACLDLPGFFCPADRRPTLHEIAERLDPVIGAALLPPYIEQIEPFVRVHADDDMHSVVT